jgi:hypothetical protein
MGIVQQRRKYTESLENDIFFKNNDISQKGEFWSMLPKFYICLIDFSNFI